VPKLEQLIPFGVLVTTPIPPPAVFTVTSSSPGTYPTQPAQVMTETTTSGIKAFPNLDIHLPLSAAASMSTVQNWLVFDAALDETQSAQLVQFHSLGRLC
jgi:hypothetical protein